MSVVIAQTRKELLRCYPVMVQLRPHLTESSFIERVERQTPEGYKLAFVEDAGRVVSVAGFRLMHSLAWGKFMYVDTASSWSRGSLTRRRPTLATNSIWIRASNGSARIAFTWRRAWTSPAIISP